MNANYCCKRLLMSLWWESGGNPAEDESGVVEQEDQADGGHGAKDD